MAHKRKASDALEECENQCNSIKQKLTELLDAKKLGIKTKEEKDTQVTQIYFSLLNDLLLIFTI